MSGYLLGALSAVWLGILTSISPCPLATNIAAISFIGRRIGNTRLVFLAGLLYTVGRMLTYVVLGVVLVASLLSIPEVSNLLQKYMYKVLGPLLILVGMVLLDLISIPTPGIGAGEKLQKRTETWGIWGAGLLGVVFALSFCPVSAALFFGSLIPLSVASHSSVVFPALYGIGTAVPVIVFAVLIALGAKWVGKAFDKITQVEKWIRRLTGVIFIAIGVYFCLAYIFKINL